MWGSPRRQRLDLSLPPSFHPSRVSPFLFLSPFPLSPPAPSQCFSICDNNAMSFKELLQQVTLKIVFAFSIHFFPITMFFSWYVSGFPTGSAVKNPPVNAGDAKGLGSIPGWGRSSGGGNGNPLRYSCLGNPMDRAAWQITVHGVTKNWTQLSD